MIISGRTIGANHPPYIIAELSANHNGSLDRALATITAAKECGADAVKIQTYTPETMTIDCDLPDFVVKGGLWKGYKLYDLYKWAQTPYEWHRPLFEHAKREGITLFSTPFDESAVDLLESLNTPAYKIASFELTDLPLIQYVAKTRKPMILSTGMATEEEIQEAIEVARDAGCKEIILLHCVSSYPAPIDQANLRRIPLIKKKFNVMVGLSDHTIGSTAALAAVALGACVIEKHFTISREEKGPDSEFSINPSELKKLVKKCKETWKSLGNQEIAPVESEKISNTFRRSLYIVKDIKAGEVLTEKNLRRIRPGLGLKPKYLNHFLGKKVNKDLRKGQKVALDDIL